MTIRIGINGFGRIGRTLARVLHQRPHFEITAINDLAPTDQLAHALKYDSVFRAFPAPIAAGDGFLEIGGRRARVTSQADPSALDWTSAGADFVLEATGKFKQADQLRQHLASGAKKVFLAVPPKDELDATVVLGVNDHLLTGEERLISNASCTTNAAAPVTLVLHQAFTIQRGFINTIHAYTNGQSLVDAPQRDFRRSRAAAMAIIPTTTGAAKAVAKAIPELKGKLDGMAYRVPVADGSIVDMVFEVSRTTTVAEVNEAVQSAAEGSLRGIIAYQTEPIVSVDIIGDPHSAIFDAPLTQVIDGRIVHVAAWYDNEYGYSCRLADLMERLA